MTGGSGFGEPRPDPPGPGEARVERFGDPPFPDPGRSAERGDHDDDLDGPGGEPVGADPAAVERGETRRAVEAVLVAATEPVEPRFLAELVELPVEAIEELCASLADEYEQDQRGFVLAPVAGGYRLQTHPDLAAYVERFVLEGQHVRLSGPALETLGDRRVQAADLARADLGHPRRERRDDAADAGATRLRGRDRPRPGARPRRPVRDHRDVPGTARARLARRTCRRSATSCPTRASSRRSSGACGSQTTPTSEPTEPARRLRWRTPSASRSCSPGPGSGRAERPRS